MKQLHAHFKQQITPTAQQSVQPQHKHELKMIAKNGNSNKRTVYSQAAPKHSCSCSLNPRAACAAGRVMGTAARWLQPPSDPAGSGGLGSHVRLVWGLLITDFEALNMTTCVPS